jgi:hypothetical protein
MNHGKLQQPQKSSPTFDPKNPAPFFEYLDMTALDIVKNSKFMTVADVEALFAHLDKIKSDLLNAASMSSLLPRQ